MNDEVIDVAAELGEIAQNPAPQEIPQEFQVIWNELFPKYLEKVEEVKNIMRDMQGANVKNALLYAVSHPFLEKYMTFSEEKEPKTKRLLELCVEIIDIKLTLAIYSKVSSHNQEVKNERVD